MMYVDSVEEQKYLSGLRKEKEAFQRLIREKGVRLTLPHLTKVLASSIGTDPIH
jgi:DNA excision repair protein ERCC-4